ncbi:ankyrin repeat domain-containing protein [Candidatus Kaiserbacteria bacterium]|nr:ankyrin repeat domain-containing protein [Candidatus Kaiserbacteria bacterium]
MDRSDEDIHKEAFAHLEPVPTLIYWASLGNLEQVKKALEEDPNINVKMKDGYTALQAAIENNHTEVTEFLLSKGAEKTLH